MERIANPFCAGASPIMPTIMTFDPDWRERALYSDTTMYPKTTKVVNLRQESFDVYIGRAGKGQSGYFGNAHPIGWCPICQCSHKRGEALAAFKKDFLIRVEQDSEFRKQVIALKGKTLGCFCKPLPCHGDIFAEWLDNLPSP